MEMPASWPFTNTGHVPASINRKMTIRVILDETKQNKKKEEKKPNYQRQTKFPKMSSFSAWKKVQPLLHINKINMNKRKMKLHMN